MRSNKVLRFVFFTVFFSVLACILVFASSAAEYKNNSCVKVGLKYGSSAPKEAAFTCSKGFSVIEYNEEDNSYTTLYQTNETAVTVKNIGGKAVLLSSGGATLYTDDEIMYLRGNNSSVRYNSVIYLDLMKLHCKDGLMRVINIISLENYIKGVLPREIYPSWPDEALKSAAVVARSFAISSLSGKHNKYGFDVCTTTCCQVYGGYTAQTQRTDAAVEATAHLVAAYDGKVALTVYTSSAGDHTESSQSAWGGAQSTYPYLAGVETPFETPEEYPHGKWEKTLLPAQIRDYINGKSSGTKLVGDILSIVCEYSEGGYANSITVTDTSGNTVSAKNSGNVRGLLTKFVNSAKFTITPNYIESDATVSVLTANGIEKREPVKYGAYVLRADSKQPVPLYSNYIPLSFTVSGTGYGHGVGLSQFGAMTLAKNGYTYDQIISTYFPGTYLTTLDELGKPKAEQQQVQEEQPQQEQQSQQEQPQQEQPQQ